MKGAIKNLSQEWGLWQKLYKILAAFILFILLWLVFNLYHPFEPHYHCKPISHWANEVILVDEDGSSDLPETQLRNQNGILAIQRIGLNATPFALKCLHSSDDEKRLNGIAIFRALGASAKPAVPSLIEILKGTNQFIYDSAMQSLGGIGSDAIPALNEMLANGNRQTKINSARCLGYYFGSSASNLIPLLLTYLWSCLDLVDYCGAHETWMF